MLLAQTSVPTSALPAAGAYVATVNYRVGNWHVTATERAVGDAAGYETLDAAIGAVTAATTGPSNAAAGVFEVDGRYVGRALNAGWYDYLHPERRDGQSSFTYLEWLKSLPFRPPLFPAVRVGSDPSGKTFPTHAALRAIVDGAALLRIAG